MILSGKKFIFSIKIHVIKFFTYRKLSEFSILLNFCWFSVKHLKSLSKVGIILCVLNILSSLKISFFWPELFISCYLISSASSFSGNIGGLFLFPPNVLLGLNPPDCSFEFSLVFYFFTLAILGDLLKKSFLL